MSTCVDVETYILWCVKTSITAYYAHIPDRDGVRVCSGVATPGHTREFAFILRRASENVSHTGTRKIQRFTT